MPISTDAVAESKVTVNFSSISSTESSLMVKDMFLAFSPERKVRVLLAEDNSENQKLMEILIKRAIMTSSGEPGKVTIVENGAEALTKALSQNFDLILMDMQMPIMNGMEAVRRLRKSQCRLPIFALTANESEEAIKECLDAGCDGHLSKPLDSQKLKVLIQNLGI